MSRPTQPATFSPGHPIGQEELMAYLDGELPVERAAEVASHLDQCRDCQALAVDSRSLDQQMVAWQVEPSPASLAERVKAAMEARPEKAASDKRALYAGLDQRPLVRRWVWAAGGVTALFLLLAVSSNFIERWRIKPLREADWSSQTNGGTGHAYLGDDKPRPIDGRSVQFQKLSKPGTPARSNGLFHGLGDSPEAGAYLGLSSRLREGVVGGVPGGLPAGSRGKVVGGAAGKEPLHLFARLYRPPDEQSPRDEQSPPEGPMIVRTASLTLVTKEFDKARPVVEEIVRRHHGYAAQLTVSAPGGAGRTLNATLRVPADQLDAALAELKKLGRVEQESQGGEEVTQQYVDLNARLKNARNTEERLIDVLRERTGKVKDILAVEQEIARVRGEIEQMDAESKNLEHQVRYAALQLSLSEEYKAALEVAPPSTGTLLRNSVVEGYRGVVASAVGILIFLASYGPALIFWVLLLFWPARFAWRRLRPLAIARTAAAADVVPKPAGPGR